MDDIQEHIESGNRKIELIEDYIALSLRREKIAPDLATISTKVDEVKELLNTVQNALQNELKILKADQQAIMRRMRKQQSIILDHVVQEKLRKVQQAEEEQKLTNVLLDTRNKCYPLNTPKSAIKKSASKYNGDILVQDFNKLHVNYSSNYAVTPKMSIAAYKESPMVKRNVRINPIPFTLLDFDIEITALQFEAIPKYMRGRESLDELNAFLSTIIIPCFNDKYKLIHRQRSTVRNPSDLSLWKLYNDQADYVPGRNFITPGDISRKINRLLDKKIQNRIVMLRHIGVLQEQRISQTVCYVWTAK